MRPIHRAPILAVLALLAVVAASAESKSPLITVDAAVSEALVANLDLQAARLAIDVARGELLQAGRLDNPELSAGLADDFAFKSEGERNFSLGFAQRFPITARLAREKEVARGDVMIAEAEVREFARELIAEVQRAFFSVRALDERITVDAALIESVRRVEDATARRLSVAEASAAELSLLRIERLRLEQDVLRLAREREVAVALLARLLGRSSPEGLEPTGELDPGSASLSGEAGEPRANYAQRPDLDAARAGIERAEATRELARARMWEDWTVGVGVERDRSVFAAPLGNKRDSLLSLDVAVPLPLWNRQEGRIAAAAAELRRAQRSREGLELRIEEEIRAAQARVRTLLTSVDAYEHEILPEATRTQATYERGYREGLIGIADLLQAQRQYNESRASFVTLVGELRQAAIDLEAATATSPHLNAFRLDGEKP